MQDAIDRSFEASIEETERHGVDSRIVGNLISSIPIPQPYRTQNIFIKETCLLSIEAMETALHILARKAMLGC